MSWILAVDIGNTSTSIGLVRRGVVSMFTRVERAMTNKVNIEAAIDTLLQKRKVNGSILCSVVPPANMKWVSALTRKVGIYPMVVTHKLNLGMPLTYPKPSSIGADRIANAVGAVERYGAPVIVADFGTALTFDIVLKTEGYVGGVIAPGLPLMTDYLADKTALLPHIELKGKCSRIGKSTEAAMRIGAKIGYRGMVREIINYIKKDVGKKKVSLCATGGYAKWALAELDMPFRFDPYLTLCGLNRIYELN